MNEICENCGAVLHLGSTSALTPLEEHVLDHNDPHQTMDLVPKTYFGPVDPSSVRGYRTGDWYVNTSSNSAFVLSSANNSPEWIRATPVAVTVSQLNATLLSYVTSVSLASTLSDYVKSVELSGFVTESDLANRSFVTSTELSSALSSYVTSSALEAMHLVTESVLSGYVTSSALESLELASKAYVNESVRAMSDTVSDCVRRTELTGYVTESDLANRSFVTSMALSSALSSYVTSSALEAMHLVTESSLSSSLSPYATKSFVEASYVTVDRLSQVLASYVTSSSLTGFVTPATLQQTLDNYVTTAGLSTVLAQYALFSEFSRYTPTDGLPQIIRSTVASSGYRTDCVYRTGSAEKNIDSILSSWIRTNSGFSSTDDTRPPSCKAVAVQVENVRATASIKYHEMKGSDQANDTVEIYVSGVLRRFLRLDRYGNLTCYPRRLVYVDVIPNWNGLFRESSGDVTKLQLCLSGVMRNGTAWEMDDEKDGATDIVLTVNFGTDATHVGPIPFSSIEFHTSDYSTDPVTSGIYTPLYVDGSSASLSGVNWGDLLVIAITEIANCRYAVSVKKFAGAAT